MKVVVYDEANSPEQKIYLRLFECPEGVELHAVDERGQKITRILTISPSGITRSYPIAARVGIRSDSVGKAVVLN